MSYDIIPPTTKGHLIIAIPSIIYATYKLK